MCSRSVLESTSVKPVSCKDEASQFDHRVNGGSVSESFSSTLDESSNLNPSSTAGDFHSYPLFESQVLSNLP